MQKVSVTLELQDCDDGIWLVGPNWMISVAQMSGITQPGAWAEERLAEGREIEAARVGMMVDVMEPEDWAPGELGCHELLDRVSVMNNIFADHVIDHAACITNPEWFALANHISDLMADLYQKIGAKHLADQD
jgi:hypothetical protein